jgi:hypothetical protein
VRHDAQAWATALCLWLSEPPPWHARVTNYQRGTVKPHRAIVAPGPSLSAGLRPAASRARAAPQSPRALLRFLEMRLARLERPRHLGRLMGRNGGWEPVAKAEGRAHGHAQLRGRIKHRKPFGEAVALRPTLMTAKRWLRARSNQKSLERHAEQLALERPARRRQAELSRSPARVQGCPPSIGRLSPQGRYALASSFPPARRVASLPGPAT